MMHFIFKNSLHLFVVHLLVSLSAKRKKDKPNPVPISAQSVLILASVPVPLPNIVSPPHSQCCAAYMWEDLSALCNNFCQPEQPHYVRLLANLWLWAIGFFRISEVWELFI